MSLHPSSFLRRGATAFVVLAALWWGAVLGIDKYGITDRAQAADVIVVLGSRVLQSGQPGPSLSRRAAHAAALYGKGLAPIVICSGGLGQNPPTEAQAACAKVESLGVPESAAILEERARSTEETSLYVAEIMRAHGWRTAIVVSDSYHLYRAHLLFERAGVAVYPSPAQVTAGPMNPIERLARANRELVAVIWYWGKTWAGLPITDFQP
ncbi:MAG: YdcF family protein [Chloroflexi bacterium]|nr:YdcF family protein [Chloroflexota bacterium]